MLAALRERGIRPDVIVGTSVGALNGAWLAGHPDAPDRRPRRGVECAAPVGRVPDRPAAWPARVRGPAPQPVRRRGRCERLIERHVTFARLEDAPVPLHVVAVEVLTGRDVLLSSGPAVDSVLASAALPALFDPVDDRRRAVHGRRRRQQHADLARGRPLGVDQVWVLCAGHACALTEPPPSALGDGAARAQPAAAQAARRRRRTLRVGGRAARAPAAVPADGFADRLLAFRRSSSTARTRASTRWLDEDHPPVGSGRVHGPARPPLRDA